MLPCAVSSFPPNPKEPPIVNLKRIPSPTNTHAPRRWLAGAVLGLACLSGCREHPQVTSRESLDFIKQVYTACNTRSADRLTACRSKLDTMVAEGQLSEAEQNSFREILSTAESGDWESAQKSSLQFARDQVR